MRSKLRRIAFVAVAILAFNLIWVTAAFADQAPIAPEKEANTGIPSFAQVGSGSDNYGYTYVDSNSGCLATFEDISATGTGTGLGDDGEIGITIPFTFYFYGQAVTDITIGNNGGLLLNTLVGDVPAGNGALPNSAGLGVYTFWDDIDSDTGDVYYEVLGTAPNRRLVVQWHQRPRFSNIGDATFQATLYETTNEITFNYLDVDFGNATYDEGNSATVGINRNLDTALQYSFNTPVITDGLAICFTPPTMSFEVTVADDGSCGLTNELLVPMGTDVTYCYTVTNMDSITYNYHTLMDTEWGTLLSDFNYALGPNQSVFVTATANITQTTMNMATWSMQDTLNMNMGLPLVISATASATVEVIPPVGPDPLVCNAGPVTFNAGLPTDWVTATTGTNTNVFWTDLAGCGEAGNYTGGSGDAACASSDVQGGGQYDTQLWSTSVDLTGYDVVYLNYDANYQNFAGIDFLDVDVSVDGGSNWTTVLSWNEDHGAFRGATGENVNLNLSAYGGNSNVLVRWHYYDPGGSTADDWYAQIDNVALNCSMIVPEIVMTKTVGTDPAVCATTDSIIVDPNTDVTYCYEVENTGNITLDQHDLTDSELGAILTDLTYSLAPGASVFVTATTTIGNVDVTNTAVWTAYDSDYVESATFTDTATVMVAQPSIAFTKTVGTDPASCATTDTIMVEPYTDVVYCYEVMNTGNITESFHDLDDSVLGSILAGFPYDLAPGASVWVTSSFSMGTMDVTNTAMWSAYNVDAAQLVTATDMATVTVNYNPAIVLTKTVGTDNSVCATTNEIAVAPNTEVTYCYEVANVGNIVHGMHDLVDSELGTLLDAFAYDLMPGESVWITETAMIGMADVVNTATWAAYNIPMLDGINQGLADYAEATDVATVTVMMSPSLILTKTVGMDPSVCATTTSISIPAGGAGADVTYCYTIYNNGTVTLTTHDLYDDQLGDILTGLNYELGVGASTFLTVTTTVVGEVFNTATWTGMDMSGVYSATAQASAAVTQVPPTSVSLTTVEGQTTSGQWFVLAALLGLLALLGAGWWRSARPWA
ncbi:MAG TPA: hypothetical protein VLL52_06540 [Anaerolineae bacterium]|nr:hypothetical protein [Anaerolineae bacterium]